MLYLSEDCIVPKQRFAISTVLKVDNLLMHVIYDTS